MLEVVNNADIKHAYQFTNQFKDMIYTSVSQCYGASPIALFDDHKKPYMRFRVFLDSVTFLEKELHIGDYIVFNKDENSIVDVLTEEEFEKKYIDISGVWD